jgi:hypothetical protein
MTPANRFYDSPHFELARVHKAAATRDVVLTRTAGYEGAAALPQDIIDLDTEIREIVRSLAPGEFQFRERKLRLVAEKRRYVWADVYRIDFEGCDVWLKLKLEPDRQGEYVLVLSLHRWDDSRPI